MTSVHITIDDRELTAQAGQTILEVAQEAGIDIPALCHHASIEPIGACRMCMVEIAGQRALQPACTFKVTEGAVVHTESDKVRAVRKFVLQLLLSERNHFCMYCQTSGDCELQNLAYRYGLDSWLYPRSYKPLPVDASRVYFVMDHNRCILCRRCVRACSELVGNHTLGLGQRGTNTMVVADLDVPFGESCCISCGTCLQVCPTGALMDRRSAYRGHEVDLDHTKSTCAFCSVGCGTDLVVRDNQLIRIDGDWDAPVGHGLLCVAGRFEPLFDTRKRIESPMVRHNGELAQASWDEALAAAAAGLKAVDGSSVVGLASTRLTNETLKQFGQVFRALGAGSVATLTPVPDFVAEAEGSLAVLDEADLFLVVGEDLSVDHQVVGMAVKRGVLNRGAKLVLVGDGENGFSDLADCQFATSEVDQMLSAVRDAESPVVIYGSSADGVLPQLRRALASSAQFVGLVPGTNARGALAAGLSGTFDSDGAKAAYILIAGDDVDDSVLGSLDDSAFVVAQASYAGPIVNRSDVVLPTTIWAEKSGTFTNTEGVTQECAAVLEAPEGVKSDQEILSALAESLA